MAVDFTETNKTLREFYKHLYGNKLDNLSRQIPRKTEMTKLTQEEIENRSESRRD
jgi:hypothetical protein